MSEICTSFNFSTLVHLSRCLPAFWCLPWQSTPPCTCISSADVSSCLTGVMQQVNLSSLQLTNFVLMRVARGSQGTLMILHICLGHFATLSIRGSFRLCARSSVSSSGAAVLSFLGAGEVMPIHEFYQLHRITKQLPKSARSPHILMLYAGMPLCICVVH